MFVEKIPVLGELLRKSGIKIKLVSLISLIILLVVIPISAVYILLSTRALMSANDKLCQTIAGNISSAESFIMVEKKPLRRSMILQDIVSSLSRSGISGLAHAAVYDLRGMLAERKFTYAAHTDSTLRGTAVRADVRDELLRVNSTEIVHLDMKVGGEIESCYRYRIPFKFFSTRVGIIEIVFTEESILGPVNKVKLFIVILTVIMLMIGMFITASLATGIVEPLLYLTEGVSRVRDGDLDVTLDVMTHDEIGVLTQEFNKMIEHLREKLQMQKFVSKSTISMIKEKTRLGDIGLGGARENLAFLFSDVRGFTAMSEKLDPEEVVSILNEYLDLQAEVIKKHDGDIDKFVGDEVMAVFGGPQKADNAIQAAVEIIALIKKLNAERIAAGKQVVEVGIGLNMGDVVHGRMGSRDRMDHTSIGDAVNLSARLCSQAESGVIIASKEIVMNATKKKFLGKKLEPVRVKGKSQPIDVFQITGIKK